MTQEYSPKNDEYKIGRRYKVNGKTMRLTGFCRCSHWKEPCKQCNSYLLWNGVLEADFRTDCGYSNGETIFKEISDMQGVSCETIEDRVLRIQLQIKKEVSKT